MEVVLAGVNGDVIGSVGFGDRRGLGEEAAVSAIVVLRNWVNGFWL